MTHGAESSHRKETGGRATSSRGASLSQGAPPEHGREFSQRAPKAGAAPLLPVPRPKAATLPTPDSCSVFSVFSDSN